MNPKCHLGSVPITAATAGAVLMPVSIRVTGAWRVRAAGALLAAAARLIGARWTLRRDVWVVGRYLGEHSLGPAWALVQVSHRREAAEAACTTFDHFMFPVTLGEPLPADPSDIPGAYNPREKEVLAALRNDRSE